MNILYVTQFFKPEVAASAKRAFEHSRHWSSVGVNVHVWTSFPNFPTGEIFQGYKNQTFRASQMNGINVNRCFTLIRPNTTPINRLVLYISFATSVLVNMLLRSQSVKRMDVVLGTSGIIFSAFVAYLIAKLYRKPFIFEIRDITSLQVLAINARVKVPYYRFIYWLEMYLAGKCDVLVCVSEGYGEWFVAQGISPYKISIITNGVDTEGIPQNDDLKKVDLLKTEMGLGTKVIVSFFGTMGESQDIPFWVELIRKIEDTINIHFLFIGGGAQKDQIEQLSKDIDICTYLPSMPMEKLEQYYAISDLCIVSLKPINDFRFTIPSKVFDIMGHGKPIVYRGPADGIVENILKRSGTAYFLKQGVTDSEIVLHELINDMTGFYTKGIAGKKYVMQNYSRRINAEIFTKIFYDVVEGYNYV